MGFSLPLAVDFTSPPSSRTATRLRVDQITSVSALVSLLPEWRALEERAENTLPFRTAEWTLAWWQHLRRHHSAMRDSLRVYVMRTEHGELAGVAPLMLTESPAVGPLRSRCLQFMGADPNLTELRGPLFAPAHRQAGFRALHGAVNESANDWDWMLWNGVPEETARSRDLGIRLDRTVSH
jgi:hypothetical protein